MARRRASAPPHISRLAVLRDLVAVVLLFFGGLGTLLITILLPNWWLLMTEVMVLVGFGLGMHREGRSEVDPGGGRGGRDG